MPIEEQKYPVATIISNIGERTTFIFTSARTYQEFITWATWDVLDTYDVSLTKANITPEQYEPNRSKAETARYDQFMADFRTFRNGNEY